MRRHRVFLAVTAIQLVVLAALMVAGRMKTIRYQDDLLPRQPRSSGPWS